VRRQPECRKRGRIFGISLGGLKGYTAGRSLRR
jgi:hypothetical protein